MLFNRVVLIALIAQCSGYKNDNSIYDSNIG